MDRIGNILEKLENGQHKEALDEYKVILNNGTPEEQFLLGEELFQYGFLEEAKSLYEKLIEIYPNEGEILVMLGEILIESGDEEQAILVLENIPQSDPSFGQALLLLADLYQIQGLNEVSERKLLEAKEILPDEIIIDFALGELYSDQGEVTKALYAYETVLKECNELAGVNINQRIADLLSTSGSFEEALPFYEKALDEKLEINTLFGFAFTALQGGYNGTAIEKFLELKELDPEYHSLYLQLAIAYEREEELQNSLDAIRQGIKQDQYNKELHFYGGKIALKLGNEEEAITFFREAIALDPGYIDAILSLNKLLIKQEKYDEVLELIDKLGSYDVEEPKLLWDAAIAFHKIEKYSLASNKYESAYTHFKDNDLFLTDYGYFLMEEGKRTKAAEIFKQLLKNDPTNEEYLDLLERLGLEE